MKVRCAEMSTTCEADESWREVVCIYASTVMVCGNSTVVLKYPINLSCSLALAEHLVHSEALLEQRLANLPIPHCFFHLSCNWFTQ